MTDVDIVERLRELATYPQPSGRKQTINEAAAEIERLRAIVNAYREGHRIAAYLREASREGEAVPSSTSDDHTLEGEDRVTDTPHDSAR